MYADRNIIVDCHKTIDGRINFLRGSSRLEIRLGAVKPPRLGQQGSKGPSPRISSITPSCPSTILSVIPRYSQPCDSTYYTSRWRNGTILRGLFFHVKTPTRVRGGRCGKDRSLLEYSE